MPQIASYVTTLFDVTDPVLHATIKKEVGARVCDLGLLYRHLEIEGISPAALDKPGLEDQCKALIRQKSLKLKRMMVSTTSDWAKEFVDISQGKSPTNPLLVQVLLSADILNYNSKGHLAFQSTLSMNAALLAAEEHQKGA